MHTAMDVWSSSLLKEFMFSILKLPQKKSKDLKFASSMPRAIQASGPSIKNVPIEGGGFLQSVTVY